MNRFKPISTIFEIVDHDFNGYLILEDKDKNKIHIDKVTFMKLFKEVQ